ncbi:MAG: DNA polymerase III subunit delta, partial [Hyphomicrobiales bacterium]|nr:DNA polymerase III subunit delta [Hyphomicrobiales bacterium]
MVAVKNHEADRYIANLPNGLPVFLVFGSDTGLVSERVSGILKKVVEDRHDPFQMVTMAGDDLADNPGQLIEEANTIGLFQTRRAVHVTAGNKSFVEAIRILVAEPPQDCTVVISAGAMRPDAPLRSTCTRAKTAAAIECYPDQDRDIARLIDEDLRAAGLRIGASAKAALVAALGADRLTTRAEIEKLILYAHGKSEVVE